MGVSGRASANPPELRALIRRSADNALWGVPRIQGKIFKLGFAVALSTVAKIFGEEG